ncbi:MAG: Ig-like domain-containing protein [Muribaculaceae bacterium]|nr:Ig-like domain-containing protein [Roseburia sp.]MCM1431335.1 Ig-like domain-containing protein [Muribaculaceae bacterium]MCM1491777.1 Ig-like domain-containing protein [Muribaculaceae bacterium]
MKKNQKRLQAVIAFLCMISMLCFQTGKETVYAGAGCSFVVLDAYAKTVDIGEEFYLLALSTDGAKITFSSADTKVASVSSYGLVTAKKAGTTRIRAKTKNAEAYCKVTVKKTTISLNKTSVSMENGSVFRLKATVSSGHEPAFKSSKRSVATVDDQGVVTAVKPGETVITVRADNVEAVCKVRVKQPVVTISKSRATLYRKGELTLSVTSTSKSTPRWKSSKSSVATVDNKGKVTAIKHGTAIITVTVDGVSKTCEVTVKQPAVKLSPGNLCLAQGETGKVKATVSSGNTPVFSSSNTSVATVDEYGTVTAVSAGKAYIYAAEDGIKAKIKITVTEK